jgi:hypothetical protein
MEKQAMQIRAIRKKCVQRGCMKFSMGGGELIMWRGLLYSNMFLAIYR